MGQDTYSKFGVSVQLSTTFKNRELIYRLARRVDGDLVYCYVQVDYDEVIDLSDEYSYQSEYTSDEELSENEENKDEPSEKVEETSVEEETTETTNGDEEESEYEESEEDDDYSDSRFSMKTLYRLSKASTKEEFDRICGGKYFTYIFAYPFVEGSARNISRRENPSIYDRCSESVDDVQESIKNGIDFFLREGVDRRKLEIGYHIRDSF